MKKLPGHMNLFNINQIKNSRRKGFSLVELLIAAGLIGLLVTAVNGILANTFKSSRKAETVSRVKNEGEMLVSMINRDVEFALSIENLEACKTGANTISIKQYFGDTPEEGTETITYTLDTANNLLQRTVTEPDGASPTQTISSAGVRIYNYLPDCPMAFLCDTTGRLVNICFGADNSLASDRSDQASASGGLKFYRRPLRKN